PVVGVAPMPPPIAAPGAPPVPPMVPGGVAPPPPVGLGSTADGGLAPGPVPDAGGAPVLIGFLVTFQNEPRGKFWPLYSGRVALGRAGVDNEAEIALHDASASARHAMVQGDPSTGQAFVEDAGS